MDELALKGEIVGISSVIKESYIGWKIWCWTTYKWWESYISYLEVLDEDTVSHSPMWLLVANCDYPRQDSLDTQRQHVRLHLTPMFHIWLAISSLQQMFLWLLLANCDYPSRFPRDRTSYIALNSYVSYLARHLLVRTNVNDGDYDDDPLTFLERSECSNMKWEGFVVRNEWSRL
jgi:hypothetical protein